MFGYIVTIISVSLLAGIVIHLNIQGFAGARFAAESYHAAQRGDGQQALAEVSQAMKLSPRVSTYPSIRAFYYARAIQHDHNLAERFGPLVVADVQRSIQQNPWYYRHYLTGARVMPAQIGLREQALRLVPNSMPLHEYLAQGYLDIGQPEGAIWVLQKSVGIPEPPWGYRSEYLLGVAYLSQGDQELGATWLKTSLEHAPTRSTCRENINLLSGLGESFPDYDQSCAAGGF
jgi:hypothetical protein